MLAMLITMNILKLVRYRSKRVCYLCLLNERFDLALDAFVAPEEPLSHVTEESSESQSQEPEKAIPNLLQVLLRIIVENEAKTPDEVRCNACVLLERALLSAKKGRQAM